MLPTEDPNGAEHVPKSNQRSKMKNTTLWERLWLGLGSFGCNCGVNNEQKPLVLYGCVNIHVF